jgi:hypothetical protein
MTHQTPEEFGAAFDSKFWRSAFRLELLDRYVAANEAEPLRRFRSGEPQDPSWREPWAQYVRTALRAGKQMARVHVVDEPLSEYLEFELTCGYPSSVAAGEDVRILPRPTWSSHLWLPERDFWLFDDGEAVVMIYAMSHEALQVTARCPRALLNAAASVGGRLAHVPAHIPPPDTRCREDCG